MNKRALIIGGSSGVGRATAENLLQEGCEVHVVGTNQLKLESFKMKQLETYTHIK